MYKHKLLEKDAQTMTGVCMTCGEVPLRHKRKGEAVYLKCSVAVKEQKVNKSTGRPVGRPPKEDKTRVYSYEHATGKTVVTEHERKAMYDALGPDPRCGICENPLPFEQAQLDHCHDSGRLRGMLCRNCNVGIGFLKDSPTLLLKAHAYLTAN